MPANGRWDLICRLKVNYYVMLVEIKRMPQTTINAPSVGRQALQQSTFRLSDCPQNTHSFNK